MLPWDVRAEEPGHSESNTLPPLFWLPESVIQVERCVVGSGRFEFLYPLSLLIFLRMNESLLFGVERKKLFSGYLQVGPTVQ